VKKNSEKPKRKYKVSPAVQAKRDAIWIANCERVREWFELGKPKTLK